MIATHEMDPCFANENKQDKKHGIMTIYNSVLMEMFPLRTDMDNVNR